MKYGERLKAARKAENLTQDELAQQSGVPQGTISKIERGDQESSTYDTVLADALNVSAIWLSKGKGEMRGDNSHGVNETKSNYTATNDNHQFFTKLEKLDAKSRHQLSIYMDGLLAGQRHRVELGAKTPHKLPARNKPKRLREHEEK